MNPPLPATSLCLVADRFDDEAVAGRVAEAVEAGVGWVQLRAHGASDEDFGRAARALIERLRTIRPDVLITVNSRLDIARALGTAFHTGVHGPSPAKARRVLGDVMLGASVHSLEEARSSVEQGADYLIFSPVFVTRSKPGAQPAGVGALAEVVNGVAPTPVLALGGIGPADVAPCLEAAAAGVAVVSGILGASDIGAAVRAYLAALSDHPTAR